MPPYQTPSAGLIYIIGSGRSGSTLVADALGATDCARHIGESRGIFDFRDEEGVLRCGCGAEFAECPFWGPVLRRAWSDDPSTVLMNRSLEGRAPKSWQIALFNLGKTLGLSLRHPAGQSVRESSALLASAIGAINYAHPDVRVIVESSKSGPIGWLLREHLNLPLLLVHVVRDPRAVVFSWTRRPIPLFDTSSRRLVLGKRTVLDAILYWIRSNAGSLLASLYGIPYIRVRYEDFARRPLETIRQIAEKARQSGIPCSIGDATAQSLSSRRILLSDRHLIGGNPKVRKERLSLDVSMDTDWAHQMPASAFLVTTVVLLPALLLLGYPLRRPEASR